MKKLLSKDFPFSVISIECSTGSTGTNLILSLLLFSIIFSTLKLDINKSKGENWVDWDETDTKDDEDVKNELSCCFILTLTFKFLTSLCSTNYYIICN